MSYDISLDCTLDTPHEARGGTYAMGGTTEPWLNVTYNYSEHFYRVFPKKGVRAIYGLTAAESIPVLTTGAALLADDRHPDYWRATEGNAKAALLNLIAIAEQAVREGKGESKWSGD